MSSCTSIFDAIAPHFAADANKETFLTIATGLTSSCFFGDNYCLAVSLRAAHMLTLSKRGKSGAPGAASGKKEGGLSINYSQTGGSKGDLSQTSYGIQLQGLIEGQVPAISVTGADFGCSDT